jgi:thioredoxin 2
MAEVVVTCPNCGRRNQVPAAAAGTPRCGNCHKPLPWIVDAGDADLTEIAEQASVPVPVDLWAPWCGPCRMVSPALAQLATEMAGTIKLVKVNVDDSPRLQQRFGVQSIATLMVLRHGQVIAREAGARPSPALRDWVQGALSASPEDHGAGYPAGSPGGGSPFRGPFPGDRKGRAPACPSGSRLSDCLHIWRGLPRECGRDRRG